VSKIIASAAIRGAHKIVGRAEESLKKALEEHGEAHHAEFPNTGYFLPVIYAMTGMEVRTLKDLKPVLARAKSLLPPVPSERVWLPYLGHTLDAGMATLFADEIIEVLKYLKRPIPYTRTTAPLNGNLWLGAADDIIMRERGIEFVDGTAPGFAAIVGAAPTNEIAVKIAQELQEKNLYVFMSSETNGKSFAEQLAQEGVELGWETRLVPFGKDITSTVFALGFAVRAAMSFGGVKAGDFRANLIYNKDRIFAFVLALGYVDEETYAHGAGAINFGFPVIADTDIPQILPTGITTYEHVVSNVPHDKIVAKAIEVRGLKVTVSKIPISVPYGPAFEGERIRKENTFVEMGRAKTPAFELLMMKDPQEVEDGKVTLEGPDIQDIKEPQMLPYGILVEVSGRKMQKDFEPVLERQLHRFVNYAQGALHMSQRDIVWIRISKDAKAKGLKFTQFGEAIRAKLLEEYGVLVDKVQVSIYTNENKVNELLPMARAIYAERDERLGGLIDETVEDFYSCILCQSFSPNHVCIITPEKLGLCGAYNWLDAKASYEISPTGGNERIPKGEVIDAVKGQWKGVNDYIYKKSNQNVEKFNAYSIIEDPTTSCGCFQSILALLPMCNGIMVVPREYPEMTPCGMKFSTLAGTIGGGIQTPGFMGVGKVYLTSPKFISANGGFKRLVWMPKMLKEELYDKLKERSKEMGDPDFVDKIADETVAVTEEEVLAYLEKVGHPALTMDPILT